MGTSASTNVKYTPWRRGLNASPALPAEGAGEWDQLLSRLGLTDAEALAAVRDGKEAGQLIRGLVRWALRDHFVPEDVLIALKHQAKSAKE